MFGLWFVTLPMCVTQFDLCSGKVGLIYVFNCFLTAVTKFVRAYKVKYKINGFHWISQTSSIHETVLMLWIFLIKTKRLISIKLNKLVRGTEIDTPYQISLKLAQFFISSIVYVYLNSRNILYKTPLFESSGNVLGLKWCLYKLANLIFWAHYFIWLRNRKK